MKRSAASVSCSARFIASTGIAWPNDTVPVLTWPRHLSQRGTPPSRSNHQRMDRTVAGIGLGRLEKLLHLEAATPGLAPRLLRGEKLIEIDRRHLGPNAAGAAEIGDAAFGADAGAGEDDDTLRLGEHPLE